MADVLEKLQPAALAAWYRRLADLITRNGMIGSSPPISAIFMREWLRNRDPTHEFRFAAPEHLRNSKYVTETLKYHRAVYLTEQKARLGTKANAHEQWAGVIPRLQGKGYARWDGTGTLSMDYQGNVAVPIVATQLFGSREEQDILYGMGTGFQVKTMVDVTAAAITDSHLLAITFTRFDAEIHDRYDWNKIKTIKVPNPDFGVRESYAVAPNEQIIQVYHKNALRLEGAGLAAAFDVKSNFWNVVEQSISGPGRIDPNKSI